MDIIKNLILAIFPKLKELLFFIPLMKSIKGPRSALTDFIEESGIKIKKRKDMQLDEQLLTQKNKNLKAKKIKFSKPVETVNIKTPFLLKEENDIKNILANENIDNLNLDDIILQRIAKYLSKNRLMNQEYFKFLVDKAKFSLSIYDCSKIQLNDFVIMKDLKVLELFQCGQLTEDKINEILSKTNNLEILRISGAFLIENINLPATLKILDLTNCSRLKDEFIISLNNTFTFLEELRLSFCYGLTREAKLNLKIERLFICETRLSENFIQNIENIRVLSVKRCPNINKLPNFDMIEYLDVEGITVLTDLNLPNTIRWLNISYCPNITIKVYPNLEFLNASHCNLEIKDFDKICLCKNLKHLDISWNSTVDDFIFNRLITDLNLLKLEVFGCFSLSQDSARLAYTRNNQIEVLGNPSETLYLLKNDL